MAQTYTYSISGDFPNGKVAVDVLEGEINDSAISTGVLESINVAITGADNCDITFDVALSAGDKTTLDGLVAAHQGVPFLVVTDAPGWNLAVQDRDLTAPPGSPVVGEYYIVASPATGPWATHEDSIVSWNGTTWQYQRPSTGFAAWVVDESLVVVWNGTAWGEYGTGGGSAVFGSNLHLAESTAVSTTTSATYQNKVSMVTATLEAGTYRLEVSYGWNCDNATADALYRVTQDGSQLGEHHQQEPSDVAGDFGATGSNQRYYTTRVFHLSLSAQSYTFDLDYQTEYAGNEASIWDAYMSLWRLS